MVPRPLIVLVHGIETANPSVSIGLLAPLFAAAGFEVAPLHRYGHQHLMGVRGSRDEVANGLLSALRCLAHFGAGRQIVPVGHSRGCLAIHDAAFLQYEEAEQPAFTRAVYLSPALDRDAAIPPLLERLDVHYTRSDRAVWWARFLAFHPFGDMGRRGYRGESPAVVNHDATGAIAGHSGWWQPRGLQYAREQLIPDLSASLGHSVPTLGFMPV